MIVKRLLADLETATSANRARGAATLARVYLFEDLPDSELMDAETALTALLDDPVMAVRRAIARVLASSRNAPPHIISALSMDHSLVAGRVLTHSPLLTDDDLIEALGVADSYAQVAIALRPGLSGKVVAMIAATGGREAMIALAVNETARLGEAEMTSMLERHGTDGEVREALLCRTEIPAPVRAMIATQTARALEVFTINTGWLSAQRSERCTREARDSATIEIAAQEYARTGNPPVQLANKLRESSQLTPSLLLRSLVCGERSLFEASLESLTGAGTRRIAGLVSAWSGTGFAALYTKAGLPPRLLGAFRAAIAAQDATGLIHDSEQPPTLSSLLIERTLAACEASSSPDLRTVNALLHRLRAEAMRNKARLLSLELIADAKSALQIEAAGTSTPVLTGQPAIDLQAIEEAVQQPTAVLAA